jgi:hypothetical protein
MDNAHRPIWFNGNGGRHGSWRRSLPMPAAGYPTFIAWLRTPLAAGGMILSLIALFHHTARGASGGRHLAYRISRCVKAAAIA